MKFPLEFCKANIMENVTAFVLSFFDTFTYKTNFTHMYLPPLALGNFVHHQMFLKSVLLGI